jgi:hypothetical protein
MAATAVARTLQVGLLAAMPDGSLRFVGDDGQIQTIATSGRFDVLREEAKIDMEGCSMETQSKLDQMHNRVVVIDSKRSDPSSKLQAQIKDYILSTLKKTEVIRAFDVREHFGHAIGENLEFEQALTYAFADVKMIISSS